MPPKLKGLDHLALKVRDIKKSLHFYVDILGFRVNDGRNKSGLTGRPNRFISCTNRHHTINMFEFRPKDGSCDPPEGHTQDNDEYGMMHFAFDVEDKETFFAWADYLHSRGVELIRGPLLHSPTHPEGDGSPGENRSIYFSDPDGNVIEIMCDMMHLDEKGEVDKEWHADRIQRDGHDPKEVPIPPIHNYLREEEASKN